MDVTEDNLQVLFKNMNTLETAFINEAKRFLTLGGLNGQKKS